MSLDHWIDWRCASVTRGVRFEARMRASAFVASRGYRAFALAALALAAACGSTEKTPDEAPALTRKELLDPKICAGCHQDHYQQWSKSMHAYAAKDPVFLAMNARGQEETKGALGTFCVNCHAPMAVREKLTTDGTNLSQLPEEYL